MLVFGLLLTTDAQNQPPPAQGGGPGQQVQPPAPKVHKRFEYKYSFKPPYLAQKDGTVPFFEYSGSELLSDLLHFQHLAEVRIVEIRTA
jgi:hypothetical protein